MTQSPWLDRLLTAATVAVTLVAVAVIGFRARSSNRLSLLSGNETPAIISDWEKYGQSRTDTGMPAAQTRIVVFFDYLCGACQTSNITLRKLRTKYPEKVRVIHRHYPFLSDLSTAAAIAAECSRGFGLFFPMHDLLFAWVDSLGKTPWSRFAIEVGVQDTLAFTGCIEGEEVRERVNLDRIAGRKLGIRGTPTILLDSLMFLGVPGRRYFERYFRKRSRKIGQ